jgi:hypothetical protein
MKGFVDGWDGIEESIGLENIPDTLREKLLCMTFKHTVISLPSY